MLSLLFFTMVCPSNVQGSHRTSQTTSLQVGRLRLKGAIVLLKSGSWKMATQSMSLEPSDSESHPTLCYSLVFLYPETLFGGHCEGFPGQGSKSETPGKIDLPAHDSGSGEPIWKDYFPQEQTLKLQDPRCHILVPASIANCCSDSPVQVGWQEGRRLRTLLQKCDLLLPGKFSSFCIPTCALETTDLGVDSGDTQLE